MQQFDIFFIKKHKLNKLKICLILKKVKQSNKLNSNKLTKWLLVGVNKKVNHAHRWSKAGANQKVNHAHRRPSAGAN
jgi:hypothetical protein